MNRGKPLARGDKPWTRSAELKRSAPLRSRPVLSPDAPVRPLRARNTDPPRRARLAVAERSGGLCERCRKARAVHVHHRQPKQAGGTRRRWIHALFNLLHLCAPCHLRTHARPAESYASGWLVPSGDDPALMPVITTREDGTRVPQWLTAAGGYADEAPESAAA